MWKEIVVTTTSEGADFVSDAFFSIGCQGVKILDPNDILDALKSDLYWDYVDESLLNTENKDTYVSSFVSENECLSKLEELKNNIADYDGVDFGRIEYAIEDADINWYDKWKKYYKPIETSSFAIVPKWLTYDNVKQLKIIKIDPGMAFGTGEHESTRMCLELMSKVDFENKFVIDVGTGSGILGIGAVLSGANKCYMCDIDSLAIQSAQENAVLNNILDLVEIEASDLLKKKLPTADVILANLTVDILVKLSTALPKYLAIGGILICSGIINTRKSEVILAYAKLGLTVIEELNMGDWVGLLFKNGL